MITSVFAALLIKPVLQSLTLLLSFYFEKRFSLRSLALLVTALLSLLGTPGFFWVITGKLDWPFVLLDVPLLLAPILLTTKSRRLLCVAISLSIIMNLTVVIIFLFVIIHLIFMTAGPHVKLI